MFAVSCGTSAAAYSPFTTGVEKSSPPSEPTTATRTTCSSANPASLVAYVLPLELLIDEKSSMGRAPDERPPIAGPQLSASIDGVEATPIPTQ